ncbi:hypothetical protein CVT24_012404 [Panaeolus cyanescens]|uniref:Uncharacterized protein n=1 Tax=Panaeolus cyanescens TaxID=181874 RepID=A0A409YJC6_9AGAR|nr:hypothetical protein CVT24_012404 [Panaeolus cyanescens]
MGYFIAPTPGEDAADSNGHSAAPIVQFPALRGIRRFPQSLRHLTNLPYLYPPTLGQGIETFTFQCCSDINPDINSEDTETAGGEQDQSDDDDSTETSCGEGCHTDDWDDVDAEDEDSDSDF